MAAPYHKLYSLTDFATRFVMMMSSVDRTLVNSPTAAAYSKLPPWIPWRNTYVDMTSEVE